MRTRLLCLVAALTAVGCRDLEIKELPPGTVYGTIVYTRPGSADRYPAAGALVELFGTSVSTTANADGVFLLSNITRSTGQIRISFDPDGIGKATRQRLIELKDINAGLNRQIALGEVLISQNARLHGKVVRGDVPSVGGHSGTQIFVPEGPYTTFTNDDGSYQLRDLPEGTLRIAFFRPGYGTQLIDGVTLRPSEDFAISDVVLERDLTNPLPATVSGHVSFAPALASALGTTVVAVDTLGASVAGSVQADGSFSVTNVPPGVYRVTVSHDGYVPASIGNVLVGSGASVVLQEIILIAGQAPDAGTNPNPPIDAGTCSPGASCPIATDCRIGAYDCSTGSPVCIEIGNKIDGSPCGANKVCSAGQCQSLCSPGSSCLGVEPGDDGQTAMINQSLAQVTLLATDDGGMALGGALISCTAPAGASCVPAAGGFTQEDGRVSVSIRLGRAVGPYTFTVTSPQIGTAALIHATATQVPDRTIYALANAPQNPGFSNPTGSAAAAALSNPIGTAVASDGTVYVSDYGNHCIRKISLDGTISTLAGICGVGGTSTAAGPAAAALLSNPRALALDEAANLLYLVDNDHTVRVIDLLSNWILLFAGGNTGLPDPYGDFGLATDAELSSVTALSLGRETPRKHVYISDSNHSRIRKVDENGIITTFMIGTGGTQPIELYSCGFFEGGCYVVFDAAGNAFVSGRFGGTSMLGTSNAIVRRSPSGALTRIAGDDEGGLGGDGVSAMSVAFSEVPALAMDAAGNLFASVANSHVLWKIDRGTGQMTRVAGTAGSYGNVGDWGPARNAGLHYPRQISFFPSNLRDLVVVDYNNNELRAIRNAGDLTVAPTAVGSFAAVSSLAMSAQLNRQVSSSAIVSLHAGGLPLFGYSVALTSLTDGGSVMASADTIGVDGQAAFMPRVGRIPRDYVFQASFTDIYGAHVPGSPVTFTVTALAPDAGTIFPVLNEFGAPGSGTSGPAVLARSYYPKGVAVASNGTIYVTEQLNHQVKVISPEGTVSLLAGTGAPGGGGDSGPALAATFSGPTGIAFDEANNKLYISDTGNSRVRRIDLALANKPITTVAGGGLGFPAMDGDFGLGTDAVLANPSHLRLRGGSLYISDDLHGRMRRLDLTTGFIEPYLLVQPGNCLTQAELAGCGGGCDIAWDQGGVPHLSGSFCGTAFGISSANGVARVEPDGGVTQVAGVYGGTTGDGTFATATGFSSAPSIAFGPGNLLYMAVTNDHVVRRIEADLRVYTVAGTAGSSGLGGNNGPATVCTLYQPWDLAFLSGGHWLIADTFNYTVRMVW